MSQVSSLACSDPAAEEPAPQEDDEWRDQAGRKAVEESASYPCPCQLGNDGLPWGAAGCSSLRAEVQNLRGYLRSLGSFGLT